MERKRMEEIAILIERHEQKIKRLEEDIINMREIQLRSHDGIVEGSLSLYVQDVDSLYSLMDKFRQIKGVESVKRIENATLEE